jgi:hypothetical protein
VSLGGGISPSRSGANCLHAPAALRALPVSAA